MNVSELNLKLFQANDMINYFKKKYLYKNYYILRKGPIFQNFAELLDDDTLLEIKYTCKKFKEKIEANKDLTNRTIKTELQKTRNKLVRNLNFSDSFYYNILLKINKIKITERI